MILSELTPREVSRDHVTDASGFEGWADGFFAPTDEAEVVAVLAEANAKRIPITVLGNGSGLTGARVAQGGWALSLENFRKLEISAGHARAGAAISLVELNQAALPSSQFYAPDPTENTASVGGTISTNASGSRSFRFGSTRRHILALRVALIDGRVVEYRRGDAVDFSVPNIPVPNTTKSTAGYALRPGMDWIDLFCGAEGTLGVVLEAELRLLPIPEHLFSAVVFFPGDAEALDAIDAWRSIPELRMLEYVDRNSLDLLRSRYPDIPQNASAGLLIEAEGDDIDVWENHLTAAHALIDGSWFAVSAADRERFRKFRHTLPEVVNATMLSRGFMKMGTDYAVPFERNRDMLRYYRERLEAGLPGHYVIYGHIGDAHVHVNMLPATQGEYEVASGFMKEFAQKAAAMGGTVSAEHGLGKRKAYFLNMQFEQKHIQAMMDVKRKLDPHWLLGRGTLFPVPEDVAPEPEMLKTRTIHVILNASSGLDSEKDKASDTLARVLREGGFEPDIRQIDKGTDLCELAREMIRSGAEVVVAAGGDGTINAVASVLAGTEVTLGVIAAGTLNHFARDLQIPIDIAEAAKIIVEGHTTRVDIGEVNGRRFINNAIIGLYPIYRFHRERTEKRGRHKILAMASAVFSVFRLNPGLHVSLEAGGEKVARKTPFLMVANNRHAMEGYRLGNRESISEGLLCVYMMHHMSRLRLGLLGLSVLLGRFSKSKDFDVLSAREVLLQGNRKHIRISLDGEVVRMELPLEYQSLPGSLRVCVPSTYLAKH